MFFSEVGLRFFIGGKIEAISLGFPNLAEASVVELYAFCLASARLAWLGLTWWRGFAYEPISLSRARKGVPRVPKQSLNSQSNQEISLFWQKALLLPH